MKPARVSSALVLAAVALAGCGGSSSSSTEAARALSTTTRSTTNTSFGSGPLAFSKCMRANGVPNFPDPNPSGGGFEVTGVTRSSPAFRAAQIRCQRYMALPGAAGSSVDSPQQAAKAMAQLRTVAECMRAHGISDFPDPRPTRPANLSLGEYTEITDYMGLFLLFPASINMQSPAWNQAAAACGSLAESFTHSHH
jgi:hypothetical protein